MSTASLPPPFIDVPGIANFRDIGDNDDGKIRKGLVYRSADPSKATEEGLQKMSRDLGKRSVLPARHLQLSIHPRLRVSGSGRRIGSC